jgi:hypothetical protein
VIIGLTGYARAGKDTVAQVLIDNYGFKRVAFADPIRKLLLEINPILEDGFRLNEIIKELGWEVAKGKTEVRRLLQALGVGARTIFYEDFWVDMALADVNNYKNSKFVITDVRFRNEADTIKRMGGGIWRVERPNVVAVNNHISESALDNYAADTTIHNNSTMEDLVATVKARMVGLLA